MLNTTPDSRPHHPATGHSVPMSLRDLPPANTRRWVIRRKALVVAGIETGLLTEIEACKRYGLSVEELESWRDLLSKHGIYGLRATRIQDYR